MTATGELGATDALLTALRNAGCDNLTVLTALAEPVIPAQACWVIVTLAGAEPGSLIRRHFGSAAWRPRPQHVLQFVGDPRILNSLGSALHEPGLGGADIGGDDGNDFTLEIELRGDLTVAMTRLAEVFDEHGFHPPAEVTLKTPPHGTMRWPRR